MEIDWKEGELFLGDVKFKPNIRRLRDLKDVLFDKKFYFQSDKEMPVYYMYRNIAPELNMHKIRYDMTVIPPIQLGKEYNKTLGHYHPIAINKLTYPEVYEVIKGEAHYLIQKLEEENIKGNIIDVKLIKAKEGDKVIIPPNYGHVSINPSDKLLIMANLVSTNFSSIYGIYEKMEGAAYFELMGGKMIKNKNYKRLPKIRIAKPEFLFSQSIYEEVMKKPSNFKFLNNPIV